ncbi:MAG: tRNA lysidine(34) synthetase TilS [Oscillospiraceae bacterium]|nr:tRNA lysidine(34) synthetase TilS [Oscillospiraceae bacterium]
MIDDVVFGTIEKFGLIRPGDNVMVCVSGGADSMALLSFLCANRGKLAIGELSACHFNHGLRGAAGDADEALVRSFCDQLRVPLSCGRGAMRERQKPQGMSEESWARELRYAFFERIAETNNAKIATAHNLNDNAETLLFRLARGTGLRGAAGIPPVRGRIIRPFLEVPRADIEAYCAREGIAYATDETNAGDAYARNRIRHGAMPSLCGVNARAAENLARFCAAAREADEYMEARAAQLLAAAAADGGWSAAVLSGAPEAEQRCAVARILRAVCSPDEAAIERGLSVLRGERRGAQLSEKVSLRRCGDLLQCSEEPAERAAPAPPEEKKLGIGRNLWADAVVIAEIRERNHEQSGNFQKSLLNNALDCDRIIGNIVLRGRRTGDTFTSARRNNTKTLKKLFNELGIPPDRRDCVPLLCDEDGIVFVGGQGPSRRAAATADSERILYITVEKRGN